MSAINTLEKLLDDLLQDEFPEIDLEIELSTPVQQDHGDYASNLALVLFGKLDDKKKNELGVKNPRELAEWIVGKLQARGKSPSFAKASEGKQKPKVIDKIEVAGPGFINFFLSQDYLIENIQEIAKNGISLSQEENQGKKIILEYSSPNIAKPFTIGHLRSTIIGDALANIYESLGWQVYRDNHLGDWGTQFGKQIYAIKTWGDLEKLENSDNPVKDLVALYVKFHEEAEKNPELEEEGRRWFKRLEDGDQEARELWQKCIDWSLKEFKRIYSKLDVEFTENNGIGYGESFFEDKMQPVITELKDKGLLSEGKEGAKIIEFTESEKLPPLMIIKKDGATLYATRDLAADRFRKQKYDDDVVVVNEVGAEQSLYFKQIFKAEELLGWFDQGQRVHVSHGLYRFKDKKMSTRKGNVVWLEDVFAEAVKQVKKRSKPALTDDDIEKIAIGALKWNDLRREASSDVIFDLEEMTRMTGNSGPYLQYSYVRCVNVLKKAKIDVSITKHIDTLLSNKVSFDNMIEIDILRNLLQYSDVVKMAATEYQPHHIPTYLYQLAQQYNKMYAKLPIAESPSRLLLTIAVMRVLEHGLGLLGIATLEQM